MRLVDDVNLCTPNRATGNLVDFFVTETDFNVSVPRPTSNAQGTGSWSAAQAVLAPAPLALIGMSLIGFGLARRRA